MDASANPYLAIGALLAAGLQGLSQKTGFLEIPAPVEGDPHKLSPEERAKHAVTELPKTLSEALGELKKDEVLREAFGPELFKAYLATKEAEATHFSESTLEDEVRALRGLY